MMIGKPLEQPACPNFSSGPCAKRPDWTADALKDAALGRSHRSKLGKAKLQQLIQTSRDILGIPEDYYIGIVPGSDTGAMEMALWGLLGARGVDVLAWESFGKDWATDITAQLKLKDVRVFEADYGRLPNLAEVDTDRDVVFTWNGTTSGVCVPNGDWIAEDRDGLVLCDATSAAFAMDLPWKKLDVITYSWQKILGGEAAHGMLILSPRAVERLETYQPPWPIPKLFRMTKGGKLNKGIFEGATINTPSMLCVEDCLDALAYAQKIGGCVAMREKAQKSLAVLTEWVEKTPWVDFLAEDPATRSWTSICLRIADPQILALPEDQQRAMVAQVVKLLEAEGIAYDCGAYRNAPVGFRFWAGATVDPNDVAALLPWLDWAWDQIALEKAA